MYLFIYTPIYFFNCITLSITSRTFGLAVGDNDSCKRNPLLFLDRRKLHFPVYLPPSIIIFCKKSIRAISTLFLFNSSFNSSHAQNGKIKDYRQLNPSIFHHILNIPHLHFYIELAYIFMFLKLIFFQFLYRS